MIKLKTIDGMPVLVDLSQVCYLVEVEATETRPLHTLICWNDQAFVRVSQSIIEIERLMHKAGPRIPEDHIPSDDHIPY